MPESPVKQHLLLNMERLNTYSLVKSELETYTRAHQAASGPAPMDIGAMSKGKNPKGGGKGGKG
eukprot:2659208-Amphidinium_carterae.1